MIRLGDNFFGRAVTDFLGGAGGRWEPGLGDSKSGGLIDVLRIVVAAGTAFRGEFPQAKVSYFLVRY